ncbi:MAG: DUF6174 domain-containing protein [Pseudomonadota bacterium]
MKRGKRQRLPFQVTTLIAGALLLLILFVSAGYFFWLMPVDDGADGPSVVAGHYERWREREPEAYRYVVRRSCDCAREFLAAYTVTVRDGVTTHRFPIPVEAGSGGFLESPPEPDTIDDVFAAIAEATEAGRDVTAGYDRELGFPVAVMIRDRRGNRGWELRDFETLASTAGL